MHLLLGDVENADRIFKLYADDQLKAWSTIKTKDPLGALCDWCREWLKRDVLNGYRDIDIEPDIESYFSDNDVVRYIEKRDIYAQNKDYSTKNNAKDSGSNKDNIAKEVNKIAKVKNQGREKELKGKWRKILAYNKDLVSNTSLGGLLKENIAVIGIVAVSICSLWLFTRINGRVNEKRASAPQVLVEREKVPNIEKVSKLEMIKEVLNEWHKVKKEALIENKIPMRANTIATPELLNNLKYETRENMRRGQNQTITVRIKDITMIYETENRVRIVAKLEYSDETRDDSGKVVGRTNEHTFMRKYNFIWDGRKWLIDK
jgi:hypothetical protein